MPANPYLGSASRHAAPIVPAAAGSVLIKSAPSLGRRVEVRRFRLGGGSNRRLMIPAEWSPQRQKEAAKQQVGMCIEWAYREDGANFHRVVGIEGPIPHMEAKGPDTQYGDGNARRKRARSVAGDLDPGYVDFVVRIEFDVPEAVAEVPTHLMPQIMKNHGQRPVRAADFREQLKRIRDRGELPSDD